MNNDILKKIIITCFILVPLLSSIISTVHLVDFFYLGNPSWISYTVAIAIEVGAVASFLTLSILSRLNKTIVWSMFIILFFMQVLGNVYFSYDWVSIKIAENPNWLKNFREMMEFFIYEIDLKTSKMILSMLIGVPIPLISVFLLKSIADYLGDDAMELVDPLSDYDNISSDDHINHNKYEEEYDVEEEEEKKDESSEIHITEPTDDEPHSNRKRVNPART